MTDDIDSLRYLGADLAWELLDVSKCDIVELDNPEYWEGKRWEDD